MKVLLTGGAGYIGTHTAITLAEAGHEPVLFDNFSNSSRDIVSKLDQLTGTKIDVIYGDILESEKLRAVLSDGFGAVIHFAALKSVSESICRPLLYHTNNVGGTLSLLDAMQSAGVRRLVFSSSATVYGEPQHLPIDENHPVSSTNPYGRTKLICEQILSDVAAANESWRLALLRYFNPVGAHPSGLIGESPTGVPNNLMPLITRVALAEMDHLQVFGTDYDTLDGSAVRDYIHVMDLAEGHVAALNVLDEGSAIKTYNLGTGRGTTVLQLISAFQSATGVEVPIVRSGRRIGDAGEVYASAKLAESELNWRAGRDLVSMCADSWRFASAKNS